MRALSPRVWVYDWGRPGAEGGDAPAGTENGVLRLAQIPSTAFGDGSHPTTRLVAGAVDLLCRQRPGLRVLDVGTGTGVLARIARARGAHFVAATDIDPAALAAARFNCELDRAAPLHLGVEAPDHWGASFDLVAANILEEPLRELAPALARALAPGGRLLLSGFTPLQRPSLQLAFEQRGLTEFGESQLEGWSLLSGFARMRACAP